MRAVTWVRVGVAGAVAALAIGACGLFEPRDSQPPPGPGPTCRALTDSTQVMLSIQEYYARSTTATCYNALLDNSFTFTPDPQDVAQYLPQTPFVAWDDSVEVTDNSRIASLQDYVSVVFVGNYQPTITSDGGLTQQIFKQYLVRVSMSAAPDTVDYSGFADLTIHQGTDGQWRVTVWVDHRDSASGNSSWGILRADNRQGPF